MADQKTEQRMVTLKIDGIEVTVPPGTMILEAAARAGIRIPTLCHNRRLIPFGACRLCVVQQKGRRGFIPACFNPVRNGMEILTNTPEIIKARRTQLQLLLIAHPLDCPVCDAGGQCELQNLVYEYGVADNPFRGEKAKLPVDHVSPFIERNLNRCILCGMCVRICDEVVGANELSFTHRGIKTKVTTDYDRPLNCEFCGQCLSVCPVGALNDRLFLHKARVWDLTETATICGYCGVGCTLIVGARKNRILRVRADEDRGLNQGNLCVKGRFGWEYLHHPERLTSPLIRKNGSLVKATWDEALHRVGQTFQTLREEKGPGSLAGLCSPRLTNEELYAFQKFMRGIVGTNHIDHAGGYSYRAHLALRDSLGFAASTNSMNEVRQADVILALRSDLSETHPVMKSEVVLAVKRRKAKLIVVNCRNIHLNKFSHLNLRVEPGTEGILTLGLIQAVLQGGWAKEGFRERGIEGITALRNSLERYPLQRVADLTGIAIERIIEAARLFAQSPRGVILISTGQSAGAEDASLARAAANLALLTGQMGRPGTGIFVLGEKNNSQGALDMGVSPDFLPGYAPIGNSEERKRFEESWKMPIPAEPGKDALAILQGAEGGTIKGLYIVGENPLVTYPDSRRVQKALERVDFLVVQDCFLTKTASLAHVVLPAAAFAEKEGTFTNLERRVQRIRPVLRPPGEARPDLWILRELAKAWGKELGPPTAQAVMEEIRQQVPLYRGISYSRLESEALRNGIQWPCPEEGHPGTPILYEADGGRGPWARLLPVEFDVPPEDSEYPWVLVSGPTFVHSGSLSTWDPGLVRLRGESEVEIHPQDAEKLGLKEPAILLLQSQRGQIRVRAKVSKRTAPGVLFMAAHFDPNGVNQLTGWDLQLLRVKVEKG
jgi:NADH-quinone oxidoreductase chain G